MQNDPVVGDVRRIRQVGDGEVVRFRPVEGAATTALVDSAVAAGHHNACLIRASNQQNN